MSALPVLDKDYLPTLLTLLEHAEASVEIIAYSFALGTRAGRPDGTGAPYEIAQKLIELKKRYKSKIKIRLYLEGRRETAVRNRITADFLAEHGIKVKYGSTHAKGFCIDEKYVLFGSTNLTNQSIAKNFETNLLLDDAEVVEGFQSYFTHLWKGGKHGGVVLPPPLIADGGFKDELISLIDRARSRLEFSIYFFHYTEIEKALIRAHERGVKVRGLFHNHKTFALSYVRRTLGTAKRLREAGLKDVHYGPVHLFTHSKFIVRDRKELLLGTGNWLHEDVKVHPQLYIRLEDAPLCRRIAKHLERQVNDFPSGR